MILMVAVTIILGGSQSCNLVGNRGRVRGKQNLLRLAYFTFNRLKVFL